MPRQFRPAAYAAPFSLLALTMAGCGGGGGGDAPAPPSPPVNNRAPALTTSAVSVTEDLTATAQLAATDPDNNPVTFALTTNPQHGTATLTAAGALSYAPATNYSGADTIGVTVSDNAGAQAIGTIAVTVTAVNDAPRLNTTALSVNENAVLTALLAGSDVESDSFTYQLLPGAAHGNVTLDISGALTYSPNAHFSGTDQVHVRLIETASGLALPDQIVNISVLPLNDAPAAHDDALRVAVTPGQPIVLTVLANDVDIDGDTLIPAVVTQPRGGTVSVNPATHQLIFEPANNFVGPVEFTYRVNDGTVDSGIATVRAVIGDFQDLIFLSDYTTPGVVELHLFDGLDVRRISDDLPPGSNVISYSWSGDLTKVAYVVDSNDAMRVYVKPLDGSAIATLRFTSALKSAPANRGVYAYINADGTYMTVTDQWSGPAKQIFMVNLATGAATRIASAMPGIVDVRFAIFHPFEPHLVMVQGQTAGNVPRDNTAATTAFLGDAADMSTLTQIGRNYSSGQNGAGEGFYYGSDPRYIYYAEYLNQGSNFTTTLYSYDRTNHFEFPVLPMLLAQGRGLNGVVWSSPDASRMCFAYLEPSATTYLGPSRFYVLDVGNPQPATAVTPVLERTWQCSFASDNRTMIYRVFTPDFVTQQIYAVDSQNPGAPRSLAPAAEAAAEQASWMFAHDAMIGTVAYFDNDGAAGMSGESGRFYALPLDGTGTPFLFANNYLLPNIASLYDLNDDGTLLLYSRPNGTKSSLELMSTHALNYSIPLSGNGETVGVRRASWLQHYP